MQACRQICEVCVVCASASSCCVVAPCAVPAQSMRWCASSWATVESRVESRHVHAVLRGPGLMSSQAAAPTSQAPERGRASAQRQLSPTPSRIGATSCSCLGIRTAVEESARLTQLTGDSPHPEQRRSIAVFTHSGAPTRDTETPEARARGAATARLPTPTPLSLPSASHRPVTPHAQRLLGLAFY